MTRAASKPSALPLSGVVVVDLSRVLAGPLATQMLADAGARVIKIEEPDRGDETRRWGPPFIGGISAYFLSVNRNKESAALDLKTPLGREALTRLLERADVVVDNFLPRQRKALGLDDLRRRHPRLIHCSIGGYDSDTPEADTPGYDLLAQAGAGLMSITGERDGDPMKIGVALADVLTAHHAAGAITTALFARERSGKGERIEISLFSSTLASLANVAQNALVTRREAVRWGNEHPSIVPYQLFHASDRPFAIGAGTDRHFATLCEAVLERPELVQDDRFATNAARVHHRRLLIPMMQEIFRTRTARSWLTRCRRAGVPASLVRGVKEALASPGAKHLVVMIEHPEIGPYEAVANPVRYSGKRLPVQSAPPALGAHTEAILRELGLSAAERRELSSEATRPAARRRRRG